MPRMVRITATNTSTFYRCDLFDSDTTHRVVRFLLAYTPGIGPQFDNVELVLASHRHRRFFYAIAMGRPMAMAKRSLLTKDA